MNETMTLAENPSIAKRGTVRLTTAQALYVILSGLRTRIEGAQGDEIVPLFGGVFAIFGHGNVAGIGEALYQYRDRLPTYRAHNEQAMANAAIAFAKAHFRRRMMACSTSDWARGPRTSSHRRRSRTSIACLCSSCPATSLFPGILIRCSSRWSLPATERSRPTIVFVRFRAISIGSSTPPNC